MTSEQERACLAGLRRGDALAWADLYRAYQAPLYRFAWQMSGLAAVAEEVTQETFLAFLRQHERFDPARGTLGAWLFGIARRQVWVALRERRGVDYLAEPAEVGCEAEFASSEVETVRRAVLRLPEPYREAVVLCELQELSYEEAARAMDCPVGTVRSRLSRARQMLAERLMPRAVRCAK